jgi:hypothetical protein
MAAEGLLEWKVFAEWRLANKEQMCVSVFKTLERVLFRVLGPFYPPLKRWVCGKTHSSCKRNPLAERHGLWRSHRSIDQNKFEIRNEKFEKRKDPYAKRQVVRRSFAPRDLLSRLPVRTGFVHIAASG